MNKMRNVYLMYIIIFLQGFVFYGPVATLFREARGLSMSEIFLIESISWVLMIILEIPWGWFADRFGYKKTLIVVNSLFFISKIVFFVSNTFVLFLIERVILSLVFSGLSGCDTALIYGSIDEKDTQKVFGKYSAMGTLGFFLASVMSTFMVKVSMEFSVLMTIFPYAIACLVTLFLVEVKTERSGDNIILSIKSAFKDKSIIIFIVSTALVVEVFQAVTVFLNQSIYLKNGIKPMYFGLILASIQVIKLMSIRSDALSKKLGNNKSVRILMIVIIISCITLYITNSPLISILTILGISVSSAMMSPIVTDIENRTITVTNRATILSIYSMAGSLIASLGNLLVGQAAKNSVQAALVVCIVMSIVAYIFMIIYSKRKIVLIQESIVEESIR